MEQQQLRQSQGEPGKCDVCRKVAAKYTCPCCEQQTCSLGCVKGESRLLVLARSCFSATAASVLSPLLSCAPIPSRPLCPPALISAPRAAHKAASGCSGKRNRAAFVGRAAFDERAFMSDYRFALPVHALCHLPRPLLLPCRRARAKRPAVACKNSHCSPRCHPPAGFWRRCSSPTRQQSARGHRRPSQSW